MKVEGVYKVRVVVSGNADPATLIRKLEKAGKHAELWGPPQKGGGGGGGAGTFPISMEQLKKLQMESFSKGNNQKKGNHEQQPQMMMKNGFVQLPMKKGGCGGKEEKFPAKEQHKSVRFELPEHHHHHDDDEFDDDDDDFDDEFSDDDYNDDDFEDEFGEMEAHSHGKPKGGGGGGGQKQGKAAGNPSKGDKGGGGGGKEGRRR